ncbi:hypothetical protein SAMN05518801_101531 [Novosphingobium sp. CF614]|uniref:hypothetical protein n=1 Tax=Novosphingobium sp. CF614 TaxID=1884364 RepID=UPI0008EB95BF|nr:hypothetical protein [Novosphingobium sp. CF614]SFF78828.1 hypothetical protein SAMN05518801_101531 [Novosphingobium sp. CF614]
MQQNPEYLQNQSRRLHARYRRNRTLINVFTSIWIIVFTLLFCGAVLDWIVGAHWGLESQMLDFLAFAAFGALVWCFQTLIANLGLAYLRHTYGSDPND